MTFSLRVTNADDAQFTCNLLITHTENAEDKFKLDRKYQSHTNFCFFKTVT